MSIDTLCSVDHIGSTFRWSRQQVSRSKTIVQVHDGIPILIGVFYGREILQRVLLLRRVDSVHRVFFSAFLFCSSTAIKLYAICSINFINQTDTSTLRGTSLSDPRFTNSSASMLLRHKRRKFPIRLFLLLTIGCIFFLFPIIQKFYFFRRSLPKSCPELCPFSSIAVDHSLRFDSSHFVRHFPDFVCPQNFRNLADWVFSWPNMFDEHMEVTTDQGQMIAPCLPPGSIIYLRSWFMGEFFGQVYPYLKNDFVLITGEGDLSSPHDLDYLTRPDSKIIHWFGQNGQYDVSKSSKFTHIPIGTHSSDSLFSSSNVWLCLGLNCYEMADAIHVVYSQHSNNTDPPIFGDKDEPPVYVQPNDVSHRALSSATPTDHLLLINFNPGTDGTGLRKRIWREICSRKKLLNYTFVKCMSKDAGVSIGQMPSIYQRNREYPFWLSPRGNGIDCHRTWEALYLDIIPIVWNSSLNVLYENLPVLIINDHHELNETFLREKLRDISKKKASKTGAYRYEKLRNAYWRHLILSKSRYRNTSEVHQRTNQCWRASRVSFWKSFMLFLSL